MSSPDKTVHESLLDQLPNSIDRKRLETCIEIFFEQKPKITINTKFRNNLRERLLVPNTQDTRKIVLFWKPLFSLISLTGVFGAFFIAVLGFWDFFAQILYPNDIYKTGNPMVILEKNSGAISEKIGEVIVSENSIPKISTPQDIQTLREFKKEQTSINAEIEDIVHDLTDVDALLDEDSTYVNVQKKLQTHPTERSIPPSDIVTSVTMLRSVSSDGTMGMGGSHAIELRNTASTDIIIPPYPEYMPIYKKQGSAFTPEEIRDKSGSGIMMFEGATESNQGMIESKVYKQLEGTITSEEPTISYRSMRKKGENKMNFYLVPNLRYLDQNGKIFYVPLMRGFE